MEFLTATILSGIAWDGIKNLGVLSGEYIKSKLSDWIVDDVTCEKIASKINNIPQEYKRSDRFLEVAIEDDEELSDILKSIKTGCKYGQNNSNSYNKDNNFVNGSGNSTGNTTNNYYTTPPQNSMQDKKENESKDSCNNRQDLK